MKTIRMIMMTMLAVTLSAGAAQAAFESGSTCGAVFYNSTTCRGAYTPPTTTTVIALPADGILDYTTFTVPSGYTVSFTKNAANTPVVIRTSGDVSIAGVLWVGNGVAPTNSGTAGDGNLGDDGQPGTGGPGGFDGGRGGLSPLFGGVARQMGGAGKGPGGGGGGGLYTDYPTSGLSGGSGGFGAAGSSISNAGVGGTAGGFGGAAYGQATLLPLIGGSGGGGGSSGSSYNGGGGGGGGGAIMIASSGTINFAGGIIYANGGAGGNSSGSDSGGGGGGGSGGAIRLVAEVLSRSSGACYATGGGAGAGTWAYGAGGVGRIRLEANTITGWVASNTSPAHTFGLPGHVFVPNSPTLAIVSVTPTDGSSSGTTAATPANPTGNADISFPTGTTTATVDLSASNIPIGSTATVHVIPASGSSRSSAISSAFAGDSNGVSTATATVTLSPGNNVLQAAVTYTVTETVAMNLPQFNGEYVAKVRVEGGMDGKSRVIYITASGKEYPADKAKV